MLDCIEIDGASNNGVDNVRDLIEKARFEPNQGKYKIYIIDEVHMLSTGAFNALLKILEEPPEHVKFILATTEIDKVPETIRSRSLRFDFKKITEPDIVKRLEFVCHEENITAEKEALEIIARAARGALRDALTLTEQNIVNGGINTAYVKSTLSLVEKSLIDHIITTIVDKNREEMNTIIEKLRSEHTEIRSLFDQILSGLRDQMMLIFQSKNTTDTIEFVTYSEIFAIFESAYGYTKTIPDGWLLIEITLMRAVMRGEKWEIKNENTSSITLWWKKMNSEGLGRETVWVWWKKEEWWAERTYPKGISNATESQMGSFSLPNSFDTFSTKSIENTVSVKSTGTVVISTGWQNKKEDSETSLEWQKVMEWQNKTSTNTFSYIRLLEEIKKIKSTLVLDLKTARFELKDTLLVLIFSKEWHYNRANDPSMRVIILEQLESMYSGNWKIECRLDGTNNMNIADEVF